MWSFVVLYMTNRDADDVSLAPGPVRKNCMLVSVRQIVPQSDFHKSKSRVDFYLLMDLTSGY